MTAHPSKKGLGSFDGQRLRFGGLQRRAGRRQSRALMMCSKQPIVANALEAARQHMMQKAPDEGIDGQGECALGALAVVSHTDANFVLVASENALVRDRHPMGVAGEIVEHLGRAAGRRFGVDHPVVGEHRAVASLPGAGVGVIWDLAAAPVVLTHTEEVSRPLPVMRRQARPES